MTTNTQYIQARITTSSTPHNTQNRGEGSNTSLSTLQRIVAITNSSNFSRVAPDNQANGSFKPTTVLIPSNYSNESLDRAWTLGYNGLPKTPELEKESATIRLAYEEGKLARVWAEGVSKSSETHLANEEERPLLEDNQRPTRSNLNRQKGF